MGNTALAAPSTYLDWVPGLEGVQPGLTVIAGPAEGTALGNMLVQARAVGALHGDLTDLRDVARASSTLEQYTPGILGLPPATWDSAARRIWTN